MHLAWLTLDFNLQPQNGYMRLSGARVHCDNDVSPKAFIQHFLLVPASGWQIGHASQFDVGRVRHGS